MKTNACERVKVARTKIALSQTEFAVALNSSVSLLTKIESGAVEPSYKFLKKIAEKYGIDYDWLQNGVGEFSFDRKVIERSENPWKEEAYSLLKQERDYFKEKYTKMIDALISGQLGKQLALKYTDKLRNVA